MEIPHEFSYIARFLWARCQLDWDTWSCVTVAFNRAKIHLVVRSLFVACMWRLLSTIQKDFHSSTLCKIVPLSVWATLFLFSICMRKSVFDCLEFAVRFFVAFLVNGDVCVCVGVLWMLWSCDCWLCRSARLPLLALQLLLGCNPQNRHEWIGKRVLPASQPANQPQFAV